MSTLENTVSMMKTLPEADLLKIQRFTEKLCRRHKRKLTDEEADAAVGKFLKPMSREDFLREIEIGEQQIKDGQYQEAGEFFAELRAEYGL